MEIDRQAALPLTADDALPWTREIASTDVLEVEDLAPRTDRRRRNPINRALSSKTAAAQSD
jgi:hypothetical protein